MRRTTLAIPVLLLTAWGCSGVVQRDAHLVASPEAAASPATAAPAVAQRPNLVVVISDDHRWDALGAAGNPAVITPAMDRMARDGVYFRQAIVSVSQCHPVRASLLTGLPAHRHGVHSIQYQEPGVAETLCRRPTGLPQGLVSDLPVSSLDLPPTLLSLAGVPVPDSWPGRDLVAALAGKLEIREAFAEWSDEKSDKFGELAFRAVRTPAHKLILWKDPARGEELYDLAADPAEARNLIADPAAREVLRDLRSRLAAWMERNGDPALSWDASR